MVTRYVNMPKFLVPCYLTAGALGGQCVKDSGRHGNLTHVIQLKRLEMAEELPRTDMGSRGQYAFPLFSSIYAH